MGVCQSNPTIDGAVSRKDGIKKGVSNCSKIATYEDTINNLP